MNFYLCIVFLMFEMIISTAAEFKSYVNATEFVEGTPAKLSCVFPKKFTKILEWKNIQKHVEETLICRKDQPCTEKKGFHLTRIDNNMTLIIEHVDRNAKSWQCLYPVDSYGHTLILNITVNTELDLSITEKEGEYEIKTSCSSYQMNITCKLDNEELMIKDLKSSLCSNSGLHYDMGFVKPSSSGTIKCTVHRKNDVVTRELTIPGKEMILGGIFIAIAAATFITIIIIEIRFRDGHWTVNDKYRLAVFLFAGFMFLFLGIGLLYYSSYEAFIALMVLGAIALVIALIFVTLKLYKKNYARTSDSEDV